MKNWTKQEFYNIQTWYHGTTAVNAKKIIENGVTATVNKDRPLDFGYGFYMCPDFLWTHAYTKKLLGATDEDFQIRSNEGYVLEFEFIPAKAKGKGRFFPFLDMKFVKFVFKNRVYYKRHVFSKCVHNYAFVAGPMSDGNQTDDFTDYFMKRITRGELYERLLRPQEN